MPVKIEVKGLSDLTPQERRTCRSLSFRENGQLNEWLTDERGKPAKVVLAKDGERMVGWGIVCTDKNKSSGYYVRASERRKGIGTKLLKTARSIEPTLAVYPHDTASTAFFDKNRRTTS